MKLVPLLVAFLLGSMVGVTVGATAVQTVHLQPGQQVTIVADTPKPSSALSFDEECSGSTLNPAWAPLYGVGDPGFGLDSNFMGNLSNVSVTNGLCTITATKHAADSFGRTYDSACLATRGTFSQKYGTWEARIRYPAGQGVWPAWWADPAGAAIGTFPEIDFMEAYPAPPGAGGGSGVNVTVETLHRTATDETYFVTDNGHDMSGAFHVYRMVWTSASIVFSIDGIGVGTITAGIPSTPIYPILNLALGAPGYRVDASTPSSLSMDIDYVRVYP